MGTISFGSLLISLQMLNSADLIDSSIKYKIYYQKMTSNNKLGPTERLEMDKQITQLMECKPLAENEIKTLTDKVLFLLSRPKKFSWESPTFRPYLRL
jgi:hypothetical protein